MRTAAEREAIEEMTGKNVLHGTGYHNQAKVILLGTRIVVPQALRKRVVSLADKGHQGVVKTKKRLRTKAWWPGMDRDAKGRFAECYGCQLVTKNVPPPPVKPTSLPSQPWEEVAVDLMGP
ncbi:hypothetical protein ACROYT_G021087 [Oculina patagonica]